MALDRARELAPELPETIAAEAEFEYRIKQDFPGATELFKAAHQALPGDVDILHRLAVAQRRTPDVQGALDSFQLAMELDANHSRSASTMVETLLYMDELERAEAVIDRWILRFPDARDLRAHRATLHLGHGDVETALSLFENMSPWVGSAFFSLATNIHFFERNYPGAIAVWDIPEVAEPAENRGAIGTRELYRAWAYHLMGDRDRSLSEARRGIELITTAAPTESYSDAFELATLATIYALVGTREEALATIDRASAMLPVGGDQLFGSIMAQGRALVLAMAGEREAALDEIERQLQGPYRFNKWLLHLDPRWDFFRDDERFNRLVAPEEKNEF